MSLSCQFAGLLLSLTVVWSGLVQTGSSFTIVHRASQDATTTAWPSLDGKAEPANNIRAAGRIKRSVFDLIPSDHEHHVMGKARRIGKMLYDLAEHKYFPHQEEEDARPIAASNDESVDDEDEDLLSFLKTLETANRVTREDKDFAAWEGGLAPSHGSNLLTKVQSKRSSGMDLIPYNVKDPRWRVANLLGVYLREKSESEEEFF